VNLMFWRRRDDAPVPSSDELLMERLSAYLDGEVTEAEAAEVEALIAEDDAAAELLGDLGLMRSAFGALGEVRAPRSFAIPADSPVATRDGARAPGVGSGALAIFRRSELFMRASAAAAALFFVVALVNNPTGSTPTATLRDADSVAFQAQTESASTSGLAVEPASSAAGAAESAAGAMLVPGPDDGGAKGSGAGDSAEQDGPTQEGPSTLAVPGPQNDAAGGGTSGGEAAGTTEGGMGGGLTTEATTKSPEAVPPTAPGDTSRMTEELRPVPAGTELVEDSSQGVGGMAPALGILAGLLTALSALTAWDRRSGNSTR